MVKTRSPALWAVLMVAAVPLSSRAQDEVASLPVLPEVQRVEPTPQLEWGRDVFCAQLAPSEAVPSGLYRVQCNAGEQRCLASPTVTLDDEGRETAEPLERVGHCSSSDRRLRTWLRRDYRFVLATPEAPPGWYRDERGRVMQYNFDLHRRVFLGAAWVPTRVQGGETQTQIARAEFGIRIEWPAAKRRVLYRLRLLEAAVTLGLTELDLLLLRYDSSVEREDPLFRVSTFLGEPRRFDVRFNASGFIELLRLHSLIREGERVSYLTFITAHLALDLWHSRDMVSFVRVRAGPALELATTRSELTLNPGAAIEGDFTLDEGGFHHFTFGANVEAVLFAPATFGRSPLPMRYRARAGYELIFLAINDQPLSLFLEAQGVWRDDFLSVRPGIEWRGLAGMRFSFWAPARRNARAGSSLP